MPSALAVVRDWRQVPALGRFPCRGVLPLDVLLELGTLDAPDPLGADLDGRHLSPALQRADLGAANRQLGRHVLDRQEARRCDHVPIFAGKLGRLAPRSNGATGVETAPTSLT